ncbi:MAG: TrkA family potassium uptake protein [Clostridia bacterium]|nr:TrkA family potassium uptake protein [Clostridia bacterium]
MKSVLVIGLGRFGKHMAMKMSDLGNEVLAVDSDEQRVNDILPYVSNAQIGDATNTQFIHSLGVNNFDLCIVAIGQNFQSSLEASALLKENQAKFVLARATSEVQRKFLLRNGADRVVYIERESAERLAIKYGSPNIFDYIELTPDYSIFEIRVPSAWAGKTILEKDIRSQYHVSILATKENGAINPLPKPDHVLSSCETLIVIGRNDDVKKLPTK